MPWIFLNEKCHQISSLFLSKIFIVLRIIKSWLNYQQYANENHMCAKETCIKEKWNIEVYILQKTIFYHIFVFSPSYLIKTNLSLSCQTSLLTLILCGSINKLLAYEHGTQYLQIISYYMVPFSSPWKLRKTVSILIWGFQGAENWNIASKWIK